MNTIPIDGFLWYSSALQMRQACGTRVDIDVDALRFPELTKAG